MAEPLLGDDSAQHMAIAVLPIAKKSLCVEQTLSEELAVHIKYPARVYVIE